MTLSGRAYPKRKGDSVITGRAACILAFVGPCAFIPTEIDHDRANARTLMSDMSAK